MRRSAGGAAATVGVRGGARRAGRCAGPAAAGLQVPEAGGAGRSEAGTPRDPRPPGQAAPACCGEDRPPAGRLRAARGALPLSLGSAAARFCAGRGGAGDGDEGAEEPPPTARPAVPGRGACFALSKPCVRGGWERTVRGCLRLPQGNF